MKELIIVSTILIIVEIAILITYYLLYITQYSFGDYMSELNKNLRNKIEDRSTRDNIRNKFQELFGNYYFLAPLGNFIVTVFILFPLIITCIFLISFMITYLCHFRKKSCCKCKKTCSYISLIFAMILSFPYILLLFFDKRIMKDKIDLPEEEIYQFDNDFNEKTRKNINFMKIRKIVLITGISLLYAIYIIHVIILCIFNKKLIIEDNNNEPVVMDNVDVANNKNNIAVYNQVQVLTTNEIRNEEK